MDSRRVAAAAFAFTLAIVLAACGSPTPDEVRYCQEEAPLRTKPVSEQLACIYVVALHRLDQEEELAYSPTVFSAATSITYTAALNSLVASDYLVEVRTARPKEGQWPKGTPPEIVGYYLTAEGMEYLHSHKYPKGSWFKRNWFPFSVAVVNGLIGISVIVVQVLQFRKRRSERQPR